ncbi:MAG: NlpC/P60 family protein [Clostridiales bacterium]|nr:NlpC/P60 family protein [Clostridiales bacterium]
MSRDGLIEVNETAGTAELVSGREQDADFSKKPEQAAQEAAQQLPHPSGGAAARPHTPELSPKRDDAAAERVLEHIDAAHTRAASKKAIKRVQREAAAKTKTSRLQFTEEERATPELQKAIRKSERAADRLDEARAAIPKKKVLTKERTFDEAAGKGKTRLRFEEKEKPIPGGRQQHNPLSRPMQEVGVFVHNKIHSVEKDNSGVEGAHKSEELAERGIRAGARQVRKSRRSRKLKPYRAAAKAEKAAFKANADFQYQKVLHDNPQLAASNPVSRFWQKQQIKRQYAKAVRTGGAKSARKAAENTRKAAKKTAEATKKAVAFVGRHWKAFLIAGCALLLFIMISAGISSCSSLFSGGITSVISTSYVSEDADMLGAEADYAALEAELQSRIDNIERDHPGYDEYRYDLDDIEHDPYVLTSILTALHLEYTRAEVQSTLAMLFERQYTLTLTEETEVRYRTERRTGSYTDAEGNTQTYTYTVEVPYNYYILNVKLENFNLSHLPVYIMTEEQLSMYAVYMSTLGNRPDLFPHSAYPNASTLREPTYYEIPPEALEDETFAAIIAEAEKYLGYPYVWGGSNPNTSFDCSGYVSWVINHSGWNVGRLGAQGLCNICTPVTGAQARPGDLIFFKGTYDTPGVSHVGIYVGNGMMIHCGNPISYANVNTTYWKNHFYAYGRLP